MTRNTELFNMVALKIDTEPGSYDQKVWRSELTLHGCNTRCCVAGWAVALFGYEVVGKPWEGNVKAGPTVDMNGCAPAEGFTDDVAMVLLGITEAEARILFDSYWIPENGVSVGDTLRAYGRGMTITCGPEEEDDEA